MILKVSQGPEHESHKVVVEVYVYILYFKAGAGAMHMKSFV